MNDGVYPPNIDTDGLGETVLCNSQWPEKFFVEYLPRMNRGELCLLRTVRSGHRLRLLLSMVIDQFHLVGIAVSPNKAQSPLIVDADAVLAFPVARQCLQPIAGRHPKIVQVPRVVEDHELLLRPSLESQRKSGYPAPFRNGSRVLVAEALDHGTT